MGRIFIIVMGLLMTVLAFGAQTPSSTAKKINNDVDANTTKVYNQGAIYMHDGSGNTLEFVAPSLSDDTTKFIPPATNGVAGQVLVGDGAGSYGFGNAPFWTSVCASGCNYTSLQAAITGLGTSGGVIYQLQDETTTGIVIADNTENLTIKTLNHKKITKDGTATDSKAITVGDGCSRIRIEGFEFVNWDESGDYVFFMESGTSPEYVTIKDNILNSYTTKHNMDTVIVSGNYVYDTNNMD